MIDVVRGGDGANSRLVCSLLQDSASLDLVVNE
jgi:hypothetical protein